ncbi:hypothetical protein [Nocardioides sp.]|uniref:hypothetical protein n=1 Tax=Nocardioides sp. TaxID=35761 RepID=UPI00261DF421|nr:hypothetical protein [Nocardioides sp.]
MTTTARVLVVALGAVLVAWTLLDLRRATSTSARVRAVLPPVVGVLGGLLAAMTLD